MGERREMHDAIGGETGDHVSKRCGVTDVDREANNRGRQLVLVDRHRPDRMSRLDEPPHQPPAHEAGGAGDEDAEAHGIGLG